MNKKIEYGLVTVLTAISLLLLMFLLTGNSFTDINGLQTIDFEELYQ